ncbi:disintegrin and metalloproteinase domain-containing protein 20 [Coturnix japonica]|uniref:ADAM metallopeptidase domain 20 n=1 Tax=Coturnix japonica TaxID=93934 RepID=A0A8C2TTD4_COTJA|nr:disintegrin and metalloproteinase domain-containing protein 20 [Coturnix japonica]
METLLVLVVLLGLVGCPTIPDDDSRPLHITGMWVTVPRQLRPRATTNPLTISYWLEVEGRPQVLRLRPRKGLASRPFHLVTYGEDGARREEHVYVQDNCFYQGEVMGSPGSLVALGTCDRGLRGVLWMEGSTYEIEPITDNPSFKHMLYRMEAESVPMGPSCGLTPEELQYQKSVLPWLQSPRTEDKYTLKYWWTHTRYVKLVVVVDNVRFERSDRNESRVLRQVLEIINIGDSLYDQLSVQLYLVGLEIWTKSNPINITNSVNKALADFNRWRKSDLYPRLQHDTAHLFAFQGFGKSLGLAYLGSICDRQWSAAVDSYTNRRLSSFIVTFVHELGHNLGMRHDERHCNCRRRRCIMYESESDTDSFSDCSYKDYFDLLGTGGTCLRQPPAHGTYYTLGSKGEYCGNKIVESGEQCDCGSKSECRRDPCCHPNCTLTEGSVCASGTCCKGCQMRPAGTLCRARTDECDLPEYCNGTSPLCSPDLYVQDGTPCNDDSYCYKGKCSSHRKQCQYLFGKQARPAPFECFKEVNTRGDRFGNCGIRNNIHYTKCSVEDALCGRLQCENIRKSLPLQNHITVIQTPAGGKKCWGLEYHVGMPTGDMGAVEEGSTCGSDKICIERTCTNISVLNYDCNVTKCHGRGVCNNLKHCHCNYGWAPPDCEQEGFGGSIDSGPPPSEFFRRLRIGLIGFFLPFVLGGILAIYNKRKIWAQRMRERRESTERS